jgi:hypothetical protein
LRSFGTWSRLIHNLIHFATYLHVSYCTCVIVTNYTCKTTCASDSKNQKIKDVIVLSSGSISHADASVHQIAYMVFSHTHTLKLLVNLPGLSRLEKRIGPSVTCKKEGSRTSKRCVDRLSKRVRRPSCPSTGLLSAHRAGESETRAETPVWRLPPALSIVCVSQSPLCGEM